MFNKFIQKKKEKGKNLQCLQSDLVILELLLPQVVQLVPKKHYKMCYVKNNESLKKKRNRTVFPGGPCIHIGLSFEHIPIGPCGPEAPTAPAGPCGPSTPCIPCGPAGP